MVIRMSVTLGMVVLLSLPVGAQSLGFWEFDSPGAVLSDSSGNGMDGKVGFDVSTETDPIPVTDTPSGAAGDYALDIVGGPVVADDSVDKVLNLVGQEFTAELWVKIDEDLNGLSWLGTVYYGRHGTGWGIGFQNDSVKFTLFGVVDMFPNIHLSPDGEWHYLGFLYEPNVGVTFYLDGEDVNFMAETSAMIETNANILWLGTEDGASRPLPGKIDRFRVTKGILDESQLDTDAANPKPVTDDTIVYFPFDEEAGPEYEDVADGLVALAGTVWFAQMQAPDYVEDTPSGTGYSLDFIQGDHAIINDPDQKLNFEDQSFTLETWAKPGEFAADSAAVIRYGGSETAPSDSGGYGITLNRANGTVGLTFYQIDNGSDVSVTSPNGTFPIDDAWHHVATAYDEDNFMVTIYVDGELVHEEPYALGILTAKDTYLVHIGGQWDGRDAYIGGLDRIRISSGVLTAADLDYATPFVSVQEWSIY